MDGADSGGDLGREQGRRGGSGGHKNSRILPGQDATVMAADRSTMFSRP